MLILHTAVLQRVKSASVTVEQQLVSSIGRGILVFAAIGKEDTEKDADSMAAKILKARLWPDESNANSSVRSHRLQVAIRF
jgi:D-tyrosyl-tRNA(Tyr) deacylase